MSYLPSQLLAIQRWESGEIIECMIFHLQTPIPLDGITPDGRGTPPKLICTYISCRGRRCTGVIHLDVKNLTIMNLTDLLASLAFPLLDKGKPKLSQYYLSTLVYSYLSKTGVVSAAT